MNLKHKHASYIYAFKTIVTSLKFKYYDLFYFKVRVKHFKMRDFSTSLFFRIFTFYIYFMYSYSLLLLYSYIYFIIFY